jgi:hypothetical protein
MTVDNQQIPVPDRGKYNVPTIWNAGDTVKWDVSVPDYPASEGWALSYELKSKNAHISSISASASGEDYTVTISAATSAAYSAGEYRYAAYVTKGSERFTVDSGKIEVLKDFQDSGNFDDRSHAQIVLDAIEAVLESRATKGQESYTIAGRSLARTPIPDLLLLRDRYKTEVTQADRADRISRGLGSSARIRTRFI